MTSHAPDMEKRVDAAASRAAYIRRLVAEAPPLTTARSAELAELLSAGGGR